MVSSFLDWLGEHETLLWWTGSISLIMFFATLLLVPVIISRIPADYFHSRRDHRAIVSSAHPLIRTLAVVLKNALGLVLMMAGLAMLVLPGQGILTFLIGLSLTDFPAKRDLERRILRQHSVARAIGWLRRRAGKPSLEF